MGSLSLSLSSVTICHMIRKAVAKAILNFSKSEMVNRRSGTGLENLIP